MREDRAIPLDAQRLGYAMLFEPAVFHQPRADPAFGSRSLRIESLPQLVMGDPSLGQQHQTDRNPVTMHDRCLGVAIALAMKQFRNPGGGACWTANPSAFDHGSLAIAPHLQPAAGARGIRARGKE